MEMIQLRKLKLIVPLHFLGQLSSTTAKQTFSKRSKIDGPEKHNKQLLS